MRPREVFTSRGFSTNWPRALQKEPAWGGSMRVFLSWSGERSKAVAQALKDWLPLCIQSLDPWMSSADIDKGARWFEEIETALESAQGQGIFCVTPENTASPWLNFEAGVVASKGGKGRLYVLLVGIDPVDLKPPLNLFQVTTTTKEEVHKLLQSLNKQCEKPVVDRILERTFEANWADLASAIEAAIASKPMPAIHARSLPDAIAELVGITRRMERTLAEQGSNIRRLTAQRGRERPDSGTVASSPSMAATIEAIRRRGNIFDNVRSIADLDKGLLSTEGEGESSDSSSGSS